jgi:hypothetical protein
MAKEHLDLELEGYWLLVFAPKSAERSANLSQCNIILDAFDKPGKEVLAIFDSLS